MRRQVALVSLWRPGCLLPGAEGLPGRLAGRGKHARGGFQVLERQVMLVGVELLGFRAEPLVPHLLQHPLQPGAGFLGCGQTGLHLDARSLGGGPRGLRRGQLPLEIRHASRTVPARRHGARLSHNAL
jgi:hypothetical protein